jgi:plastocyanin
MSSPAARVFATALVCGVFIAATSTHPIAQQQGAIARGRVEIGVPIKIRRPSAAYASRSILAPALASASELRNVVVYLKDAPTRPAAPVRVEIRQRNENFFPRVVAVPVGSTVDFPNDDPIYHNVFSLSQAKAFNLGRYGHGASEHVRFDKPGIVKVFCDIHSHMTATVVVFNHPWFVVPSADGSFELPDLPPGERELSAWHERLGDTTVRLRLEAGRETPADFVLPVPAQ